MGAHAPGTEPLIDGAGDGRCSNARELFRSILPAFLGALAALVLAVPILYLPYQMSFDNGKHPEFSVAVAGFSGLDAAAAASAGGATPTPTLLDPTFDLTVGIKEPRKWSTACVPRGTTAVVSYRRVRLATGPVPGFCGQNENTTEVGSVMAWGTAVPVPRFAVDSLADELGRGEADVDVKLMGPARYCAICDQLVIECKARLGRGEASPPCTVRYDTPTLPDDPARPRGRQQARKELRTPQASSE
ncbi:hypothetical protein SORBI_3004G217400 [Sorghum bicolor]|uniref:Late embryogenesis abundant protein LEA-2 subgroup domain-containing protein n=1 Tax=Sorghum bicolor TaxID=4558 RepID=C5XXQ9_SORBI|nr:hypothetical protein SORBI_3004G217400 [Sorghum bicolor]